MSTDDPDFGSFMERRNFIIEEIGRSIAGQVSNKATKSINRVENVTSVLNVVCGTEDTKGNDLCPACIKLFIPNPDTASTKDLKRIRNTACSGLCICNLRNIDMTNNVLVNGKLVIDQEDINVEQVVREVEEAVRKRYGRDSTKNDKFTKNITDIVSSIKAEAIASINLVIASTQIISTEGAGIEVSNVSLATNMNAVVSAIAKNRGAIDTLDDLVTQQMDYIRERVNESIVGGFQAVFREVKGFLIGTGVTILVLMLLISGLLLYRAAYGRK